MIKFNKSNVIKFR